MHVCGTLAINHNYMIHSYLSYHKLRLCNTYYRHNRALDHRIHDNILFFCKIQDYFIKSGFSAVYCVHSGVCNSWVFEDL